MATTIDNQITFQPNKFRILIPRTGGESNLDFWAQSVTLPQINLQSADIPYSNYQKAVFLGEKIDYGDYSITSLLGENFSTYLSLFNWIHFNHRNSTDISVDNLPNNYINPFVDIKIFCLIL